MIDLARKGCPYCGDENGDVYAKKKNLNYLWLLCPRCGEAQFGVPLYYNPTEEERRFIAAALSARWRATAEPVKILSEYDLGILIREGRHMVAG